MKWLLAALVLLGLLPAAGFLAGRHRCPACGASFRPDPERVRFGHYPCPKCGISVEVDH